MEQTTIHILAPVWLYTQVKTTEKALRPTTKSANSATKDAPPEDELHSHIGRCHTPHTTPMRRLAASGP